MLIPKRYRLAVMAAALVGLASPAWAVAYVYDALGRVTRVTYDDGSVVQYFYDAAGNRTSVVATKN